MVSPGSPSEPRDRDRDRDRDRVRVDAALIPPPRQNQTRYQGVFAANASLRAAVTALVPGYALAGLFRDDLLVCPHSGPMIVLATITDPAILAAILTHLNLPTQPPPLAPPAARPGSLLARRLRPAADLDACGPA